MPKITTYDFIESNTRKTIYLLISFAISLLAIVYLGILFISLLQVENMSEGTYQVYKQVSVLNLANHTATYILPIVSVVVILWILLSYYYGQHFILGAAKAVELTKQNAPEILKIVETLAITTGLPTPKVYSINDMGMNAFATGRDPKHSYIVLTKGLINGLEKSELEGVIAHEMAHIGNRDIKIMLVMVVCISFATVVAEILLRTSFVTKTNNSKNNNVAIQMFLLTLAVSLYVYGYLVAPLIKFAVSRTREFQADATAALITRNPQGLISALEKISEHSVVKSLSDKQTMSPICIISPLAKNKQGTFFSKISGLFLTHPPIEERIKALKVMDSHR
ncbi:MAG: M48 family metallopeptidase [Endomicrobium sp.]|jgi:heat shock protein HtpX|nr:M48 family metallopeptidase [Endomicrobium sp.]